MALYTALYKSIKNSLPSMAFLNGNLKDFHFVLFLFVFVDKLRLFPVL